MIHTKRSEQIDQGDRLLPYWRTAEYYAMMKRKVQYPKRYTLLMREALRKTRLRWFECITFWNSFHHPIYQNKSCNGGMQTFDFIVAYQGKMVIVLIENPNSLRTEREKNNWRSRIYFLEHHRIPWLKVPHHLSSQEYQILVLNYIRKLNYANS